MFNFNRLRNEELQHTIDRMKANVAKYVNKKKTNKLNKLKKKDPEAAAKVRGPSNKVYGNNVFSRVCDSVLYSQSGGGGGLSLSCDALGQEGQAGKEPPLTQSNDCTWLSEPLPSSPSQG